MNPSTALARAIVAELVGAGVREVVLCPGSRSAPLAYAVAAAERAGLLRLHVRVDERSAGFLAVGLGKVTGVPAAVVTTSGTAVANLHPAVLEAGHAHVPLVVVSADRPGELRGTGANQTTTQPGIFAGAVRIETDLSADASEDDLRAAVRDAARAWASGPVHLNVQLREPLVPDPGDQNDGWPGLSVSGERRTTGEDAVAAPVTTAPPAGTATRPVTTAATDGPLPAMPPLPDRTLVVLGDLPRAEQAAHALAWASRRSLPVLAEPFGPHPRPSAVSHGVVVAGDAVFVDEHAPECVVVIGRPTLSRPVAALVRRPGVRLVVVDAGPVWRVPGAIAEVVRFGALLLEDESTGSAADASWRGTWLDRGALVEAALRASPPAWPTGAAVARTLGTALPDGAILFTGSSNSPRDLDAALGPDTRQIEVVGNRGLAGIDGCVSTAVGIALSQPERPAYALMGDLTFLHDANGLLGGPSEPRPNLTVVVVNDDGGGIFSLLEPGAPSLATDFERLFGTPTGTDLAAVCRAHGVRHLLAATSEELSAALAATPDGVTVVEVRVDRASHRDEHARLRALAAGIGDGGRRD